MKRKKPYQATRTNGKNSRTLWQKHCHEGVTSKGPSGEDKINLV